MIRYDVSKQKGGQYYVHPAGFPNDPVPGSYGDKKKSLKIAANLSGMTMKQYLKTRKG